MLQLPWPRLKDQRSMKSSPLKNATLRKNATMDRFTLQDSRWYAAEFIGEEFGQAIRSYSPIRVTAIRPKSNRKFELQFYTRITLKGCGTSHTSLT